VAAARPWRTTPTVRRFAISWASASGSVNNPRAVST
jgi:hypothetical protein